MPDFDQRIAAVRRFNRFYTQRIGVLQSAYLGTPFSLTEARVLFELAHRDGLTAAVLVKDLGLDAGYLSRMLRSFATRGLIRKRTAPDDGRASVLSLTPPGRKAFAPLDARSRDQIRGLLSSVPVQAQTQLVSAMDTIETMLVSKAEDAAIRAPARIVLRPPQPGDLGWMVHRHGIVYARDYGWGEQFEGLVVRVVADFAAGHDPTRERCWIAEHDGENAGSVMLVRQSARVAKLRLLLVEQNARGLGIGGELVDACIAFARQAGYHTLTLWTHSVLVEARRIYKRAGFVLTDTKQHREFGAAVTGETWQLAL